MQITLSNFWIILLITVNVISIAGSIFVKFNDMKHLKSKVKWICGKLEKLESEQIQQGKDISILKGRLNGR